MLLKLLQLGPLSAIPENKRGSYFVQAAGAPTPTKTTGVRVFGRVSSHAVHVRQARAQGEAALKELHRLQLGPRSAGWDHRNRRVNRDELSDTIAGELGASVCRAEHSRKTPWGDSRSGGGRGAAHKRTPKTSTNAGHVP